MLVSENQIRRRKSSTEARFVAFTAGEANNVETAYVTRYRSGSVTCESPYVRDTPLSYLISAETGITAGRTAFIKEYPG